MHTDVTAQRHERTEPTITKAFSFYTLNDAFMQTHSTQMIDSFALSGIS